MLNQWNDIDSSWTLFLDRDGVINKRLVGSYVKTVSEFEWLPGAREAIARMNRLFGRTVVVTNQQGIGKGLMTSDDLHRIHNQLSEELEAMGGKIDAFYFCPELASKSPNCRKPNPTMAHQAQRDFPEIDFSKSVMVGDSPSDIQFGARLQMRTVFIANRTPEDTSEITAVPPDLTCRSLAAFAALVKCT